MFFFSTHGGKWNKPPWNMEEWALGKTIKELVRGVTLQSLVLHELLMKHSLLGTMLVAEWRLKILLLTVVHKPCVWRLIKKKRYRILCVIFPFFMELLAIFTVASLDKVPWYHCKVNNGYI